MSKKVSNRISCLYFVLSFFILNAHCVNMDSFASGALAESVNRFVRIICNMGVPTFFSCRHFKPVV